MKRLGHLLAGTTAPLYHLRRRYGMPRRLRLGLVKALFSRIDDALFSSARYREEDA